MQLWIRRDGCTNVYIRALEATETSGFASGLWICRSISPTVCCTIYPLSKCTLGAYSMCISFRKQFLTSLFFLFFSFAVPLVLFYLPWYNAYIYIYVGVLRREYRAPRLQPYSCSLSLQVSSISTYRTDTLGLL